MRPPRTVTRKYGATAKQFCAKAYASNVFILCFGLHRVQLTRLLRKTQIGDENLAMKNPGMSWSVYIIEGDCSFPQGKSENHALLLRMVLHSSGTKRFFMVCFALHLACPTNTHYMQNASRRIVPFHRENHAEKTHFWCRWCSCKEFCTKGFPSNVLILCFGIHRFQLTRLLCKTQIRDENLAMKDPGMSWSVYITGGDCIFPQRES